MQTLLVAIVTWLSINYSLPAVEIMPRVRFAQPIDIVYVRHGASTSELQRRLAAAHDALPAVNRREVVAVYDSRSRTILLPVGWTARTPAELSMLVHEVVHYLQDIAQVRYPCPQEREALAYEAQERWLDQFGTSLEAEFDIDRLTLLVTTRCGM